jgi:hypothetical protein
VVIVIAIERNDDYDYDNDQEIDLLPERLAGPSGYNLHSQTEISSKDAKAQRKENLFFTMKNMKKLYKTIYYFMFIKVALRLGVFA